jgi:N-acetylneuraminic acid mutarotase
LKNSGETIPLYRSGGIVSNTIYSTSGINCDIFDSKFQDLNSKHMLLKAFKNNVLKYFSSPRFGVWGLVLF